jgi:hypothetical protein
MECCSYAGRVLVESLPACVFDNCGKAIHPRSSLAIRKKVYFTPLQSVILGRSEN